MSDVGEIVKDVDANVWTTLAVLVMSVACTPLGVAYSKATTYSQFHNLVITSGTLMMFFLVLTVLGPFLFEFKRIVGVVYTFAFATIVCLTTLCLAIWNAPVR